jgi:hypothetical protein
MSQQRFTFLLAALLLLLLVAPVAQTLYSRGYVSAGPGLLALLFAAVLLAALPAVGRSRTTIAIALALAAPAIVLRVVDVLTQNRAVRVGHHAFGILFVGLAIALILRYLFTTKRVTLNTVNASLCIYMLLGVLWSSAYSVVVSLQPDAFSIATGAEQSITMLYYSFTTLTTLGYGDIAPVSDVARMLAVIEAVVGQGILVVLVARLVGLHVAQSTADTSDRASRD